MFDFIFHIFNRMGQLWTRILSYDVLSVAIELFVIGIFVYFILKFLQGTRGGRMLKGAGLVFVIVSLIFVILSGEEGSFQRLKFLYGNLLTFASFALIIVFQPELRRALVKLGETRFITKAPKQVDPFIDDIVKAMNYLARNKIGALIAIERETGLNVIAEEGVHIDADVSAELLQTIFWPGSALHDLGVVIRKDRIYAAGVQFPMADGADIPQELGSRHRAALGLSGEADCLVLVVSEETGIISVAERGEIKRGLTPLELENILRKELFAALREEWKEEKQEVGKDGIDESSSQASMKTKKQKQKETA